jgi:hypothetical protein
MIIDTASASLKPPFGLSLSKPCAPFDKLRANGPVGCRQLKKHPSTPDAILFFDRVEA